MSPQNRSLARNVRALLVLCLAIVLTSCVDPKPTPITPSPTAQRSRGGGKAACPHQDSNDAARERMFSEPDSPDAAKAEVFDPAFERRTVTGYIQGGRIIYQGDIIVAESGATTPFAMVVRGHRWPKGDVPYIIDPSLPDRGRVKEAISSWERHTPIRFPEFDPALHRSFIRIVPAVPGEACLSQVGMRGGEQQVHLESRCQFGQVLHELGHVVGLWHEQSRADRDAHVCILWENVNSKFKRNFDQQTSNGIDVGAYDYDSIMHYEDRAFSVNGRPTIHPLRAGVRVGQRTHLSQGDISAVRRIYNGIAPADRF